MRRTQCCRPPFIKQIWRPLVSFGSTSNWALPERSFTLRRWRSDEVRSWPGFRRFVSTFPVVRNHFAPLCSQGSALSTRLYRLQAMAESKSVTAAARNVTASAKRCPIKTCLTSPFGPA
jgi:hypothetical protein